MRQPQVMGVALDWIERHCKVPGGFKRGAPFLLYDFQVRYLGNFYLVRGDAEWVPDDPILAPAFVYRRGLLADPQKKGKGPMQAAQLCLEGAGPSVFAGWATGGETYRCDMHGCGCGWVYQYSPGEPMGMPRPDPLIQVTAVSDDQTDNTYGWLKSMVRLGPLSDLMLVGEDFARLPGGGKIETVTSSAMSRLGNPITFASQDEVGLWVATNKMIRVADTQYRGLAGMGGRASLTTNAWDPAEQSVAQIQYESSAKDVYRQFVEPPKNLSYRDKRERRKIHIFVYGEALKQKGGHVDLDAIEAEAADLLERDPAQAERFFGNRIVHGMGSWLKEGLWGSRSAERPILPAGSPICLGFDGSLNNDWTAIRARTVDGWGFTPRYGPDRRPTYWNPAQWGGEIPRGEVRAAIDELYTYFDVERGYFDPEDWETEIDAWALKYGEKRVLYWRTNRVAPMYEALRRIEADLVTGAYTHDGCKQTGIHYANARKVAKPGQKYILAKPTEAQKIDLTMADVLAHEAAADARIDGWGSRKTYYAYAE